MDHAAQNRIQRLLLETAPKGFSPDWVRYEKDKGWQLEKPKKH
ncbi:glycosyl hydrolase family 8 [Escherichia coli]